MVELGVALASEELTARDLVRHAVMAEEAGFQYAAISDHFHPWIDRQGESPFVWSVLGAIAASTQRLEVGTMVTCPTVRLHPAIVAQAAATTASLMPGRFFLGLGSGENLNEHVVGEPWPRAGIRIEMLEEAIAIIRRLWNGETCNYDGQYYTLDTARIYSMPESPPPIYVAAAGPRAARLAGRAGDGLIATSPDRELVEQFMRHGNRGPRFGQVAVSIQSSEEEGVRLAHEIWPTSALKGGFKQELPRPAHFDEVVSDITPEQVSKSVVCSLDPQKHIEAIREFEDAGFTRVYVKQVGKDIQRFLDFYKREVIPAVGEAVGAAHN